MGLLGHRDCTGSRMLGMINSTDEQKEEKIVAEVKAAPAENAIPSTPTPDPITEAKATPEAVAPAPAVPSGTAATPEPSSEGGGSSGISGGSQAEVPSVPAIPSGGGAAAEAKASMDKQEELLPTAKGG